MWRCPCGDGTDFVVKLGGGLDFYVSESWAVTLDATYVRPFDKLDQLQYISFNCCVMFRFYETQVVT